MTEQTNPLSQFYRQEVFRSGLPSKGSFYGEGIVALDENLEVGIMPMTANDELMLKSPDALLTGKAIADVIKSCAPEVQNPKKMLSCDIDALMISIRRASYGDEADMQAQCPECEEQNTFGIDLETLLNSTETLDESYEVVLPQGLTVFLTPGTFETVIKQYKVGFENAKAQRAIASAINEDSALALLSKTFRELSKLNFQMINDAIIKIIFTNDDGEEETITNKKYIAQFIANVDKKSVDIINTKITEINKIGVQRTFEALCTNCTHKWEADVEFNPVNFS